VGTGSAKTQRMYLSIW